MARRSWRTMHRHLAARGCGRRESGAFLLSAPSSRRVTAWVAFDDLDPDCLTGGITLRGTGFSRLWDLCEHHRLVVIADLHTHPGSAVEQSRIDAAHPMIGEIGHVALISPHYAIGDPTADQVGVHIHHGSRRWQSVPRPHCHQVLALNRVTRPARRLQPQPARPSTTAVRPGGNR